MVHLLVVDDDDLLRRSLAFNLEKAGYRVSTAANAEDALLHSQRQRPDLVVLDIGLPGMSGFDIARAFREDDSLKDVFLVALSGYAQPEDVQQAQKAGFERHLAKPPSLEKLEELLGNLR